MVSLIYKSKNGCVINPFEVKGMTVSDWNEWVGFAETILFADGKLACMDNEKPEFKLIRRRNPTFHTV